MKNLKEKVLKIANAISDKKGMNIIVLDVQECSTMTKYLIIAQGNVERHTIALANQVRDAVKEIEDLEVLHTEGEREGDWIVMDLGDLMIHLLIPFMRERYQLESLWKEASILNV
jgi:ribosome-associated protein